jgi:hypothetical protein
MRLIAHRVNATGVNPPIVKIEQRTHRKRIVNGLIAVTRRMQ